MQWSRHALVPEDYASTIDCNGLRAGRLQRRGLRSEHVRRRIRPHMSLSSTDGKGSALRALTAVGCIAAVLLAILLSAIPQLHEQIHTATGMPNHECAVTLLTSGNYQHTTNTAISLAPPAPAAFAHVPTHFQLVHARLEFSLLEHAPPAVS
jgi:hypothetical protein